MSSYIILILKFGKSRQHIGLRSNLRTVEYSILRLAIIQVVVTGEPTSPFGPRLPFLPSSPGSPGCPAEPEQQHNVIKNVTWAVVSSDRSRILWQGNQAGWGLPSFPLLSSPFLFPPLLFSQPPLFPLFPCPLLFPSCSKLQIQAGAWRSSTAHFSEILSRRNVSAVPTAVH